MNFCNQPNVNFSNVPQVQQPQPLNQHTSFYKTVNNNHDVNPNNNETQNTPLIY